MNTKEIILEYWKSWQGHSNWHVTRQMMADDFLFDAGIFKTTSADALIDMMKKGNPWKDIELLDMVVYGSKGALIYEGTDAVTGSRIRIAEILTVANSQLVRGIASISQLPE